MLDAVQKAISTYKMAGFDTGSISHGVTHKNDTLPSYQSYVTVEDTESDIDVENNNHYGFTYYSETDVYEIERMVSDDKEYLATVVIHVVEKEGPIHFELLCKRVATLFGNQKATVKVRDSVDYVLNVKLKQLIIQNEGFCWHKHVQEIRVRIPSTDGNGRTINYICKEEIAEAMFAIVGKCFGITKSDLYVVTARMFGFNRTGANIVQSMEQA